MRLIKAFLHTFLFTVYYWIVFTLKKRVRQRQEAACPSSRSRLFVNKNIVFHLDFVSLELCFRSCKNEKELKVAIVATCGHIPSLLFVGREIKAPAEVLKRDTLKGVLQPKRSRLNSVSDRWSSLLSLFDGHC